MRMRSEVEKRDGLNSELIISGIISLKTVRNIRLRYSGLFELAEFVHRE